MSEPQAPPKCLTNSEVQVQRQRVRQAGGDMTFAETFDDIESCMDRGFSVLRTQDGRPLANRNGFALLARGMSEEGDAP